MGKDPKQRPVRIKVRLKLEKDDFDFSWEEPTVTLWQRYSFSITKEEITKEGKKISEANFLLKGFKKIQMPMKLHIAYGLLIQKLDASGDYENIAFKGANPDRLSTDSQKKAKISELGDVVAKVLQQTNFNDFMQNAITDCIEGYKKK